MALSQITYVSNGSQTEFAVQFAAGYLDKKYVSFYYVEEDQDGVKTNIDIPFVWLNDNLIQITGTVPPTGTEMYLTRTMEYDDPLVRFDIKGSILHTDLNTQVLQLLMLIQEVKDGRNNVPQSVDLNMNFNRIENIGAPIDPNDAVRLIDISNYTTLAQTILDSCKAAETAARASANSASSSSSNATTKATEASASAQSSANSATAAQQAATDAQNSLNTIVNDENVIAVGMDLRSMDSAIQNCATNMAAILDAPNQAHDAMNSADLAQKWAANPEDVVVSTKGSERLFSSYHYMRKSQQYAASLDLELLNQYSWKAPDLRFIEAKILNEAYIGKTYWEIASSGASNVFSKDSFILKPCAIKMQSATTTGYFINYVDYEVIPSTILDGGTHLDDGRDYYIYVVQNGDNYELKCSLNASYPAGYTADTSRKIGGFHTVCTNVGTITGHIASGYNAGDIIPNSFWCLGFRPISKADGMVYIDVIDKWVDIYLQSGTGVNTASVFGATITDTRYPEAHIRDLAAVNKELPTSNEFSIFAYGSNQNTNIQGSADPVRTGGHIDTAGRRMISWYFLEDCCGALWQWCDNVSAAGGSVWSDLTLTGADYYGNCFVLLAGGNWANGAHCGSGSRLGSASLGSLYDDLSARGVSRNMRLQS